MPFLGVQPTDTFASVAKQTITGNGGTGYTLDYPVATANDIALFINNVRQEPTTAYTASGTTLTLSESISSSDSCYLIYIARTFQSVSPYSANTSASDFFALPVGTTAQRPANPQDGYIRYNTTLGAVEIYHTAQSAWQTQLVGSVVASGGTETTAGNYRYHTFTSSGTFTVTTAGEVEYLVIAGGGAGGTQTTGGYESGGGGAGGYISSTATVSAQSYSIVIGAGGSNANGANSSALGSTAIGGGRGGNGNGSSGGSGGGGTYSSSGGAGTSGQGFAGSNGHYNEDGANRGGGGGGAGEAGSTDGRGQGGDGLAWLDGTTRAGGGGGGQPASSPSGGEGGGGNGGTVLGGNTQTAGSANTGGGGGGSYSSSSSEIGGNGGSGIVIIRYAV